MVVASDGAGAGGGDVVVAGMSGRLPESDTVEEFAAQLFAGADLVTADDRRWTPGIYGMPKRSGKLKDLTHFDAAYFGVNSKQADVMDPQLRLLLEVTHEAVVDAGLGPAELRGSRTGVYVALSRSETLDSWSNNLDKINGYAMTGCAMAMFPNRISYAFDFKGPSISIDTACSSSMSALTQAVNDMNAGRCDAAVVAATNLCLDPATTLNFHRLRLLSPEGRCAVFDAGASGYARSEAVVALLLVRRGAARRQYCAVRGARINSDGYKAQGITYPDGGMQRRLAQETLDDAGLRPEDIVYLETHGTGTKAGDPEEVNAIAELFCKDRLAPLLLGSIKSNMGHAEIASGLCSIVKIILAMERGVIPGNIHFHKPNPNIPALHDGRIKVVNQNLPWQGGLVGVNSFGFGGVNAHVILEGGCGSRPPPAEYERPRLVLASGRTEAAVEQLLMLAAQHPRDAELHALIDSVHANAIPGHPYRGYVVLDPARGTDAVLAVRKSASPPRPIWFVFSGMGSQWRGMARDLLRLPAFAASVARSAAALEPYGVDLHHVITEAPDVVLGDIINTFVAIIAVQVALVDVLRDLDVHPDGIVGHSLGEIGCAYADGALSAEQAVLGAYWRGRCTREAAPARARAPGAMAAVGLSWREAARRCPPDIDVACDNTPDCVTVSGPKTSVDKFVEQLTAEGVFVKKVETGGVAFHSRYVAGAAPQLRARLASLIPAPRARSARWLSSSVPQEQDQWDSPAAKLCDAEYFVNNFVSPVRFLGALARVPARAQLLELAPRGLLQALLRRALPRAAHAPLVRRDARDALVHLLATVGDVYANGAQPKMSHLYGEVAWPVSRGTPSLAAHVGWDHSAEWRVADFKTGGHSGERIEYDLANPDDAFLAGFSIDGRVIFPAAGYLMLVWRVLAKINKLDIEQVPIVLENVHFHGTTVISREAPLQFIVSLLDGTGEFEVCERGEVVVTGVARVAGDPGAERLPAASLAEYDSHQEKLPALDSEDIYKELLIRGYNYQGLFRGIKSSDATGSRGSLEWQDNWITFMETAMQFSLIRIDKRVLHLPTRLERVVIDPAEQRRTLAAAASVDGSLPVRLYRDLNTIVTGGVEFRGLKTAASPRCHIVANEPTPKLEKFIFLPLVDPKATVLTEREALGAALQLILENCYTFQLKISEPALQQPLEKLLLPRFLKVVEAEPAVQAHATLAAGAGAPRYAALDPLGIKISNKEMEDGGLETHRHVVLAVGVLARRADFALNALGAAAGGARAGAGLVLLEESPGALAATTAATLLARAGLVLVAFMRTESREYVLLQRVREVPAARVVVEVRDDDYSWVERLQRALQRAESAPVRVLAWARAAGCGAQGLAKCLQREPGGERLRLYFLPGARDAFDPDAPAYQAQVQKDLAFNVLQGGVWGTFRHLEFDDTEDPKIQVEHAYVSTLTPGDMSSLRWIAATAPHRLHSRTELCRVYYAPLNIRDVMLATGKLAPQTLPGDSTQQECIFGLEFSGRTSTGQRVMGLVASGALTATVLADQEFTWEVPNQWSMVEAATVPVAYVTAYYALLVRARVRRGASVLVLAGAGGGGAGLAAVAVALHAGCTVFTAVDSAGERALLRERFPQLPDANVGSLNDCSFEQLVLSRTLGRGVDLVLSSLEGNPLRASCRCLTEGGCFVQLGEFNISVDKVLRRALLLQNATVLGVSLEKLFEEFGEDSDKNKVLKYMTEGIAAGTVRPLPVTVFPEDQLEQAFQHTAAGTHVSKAVICVQEEEAGGAPAPAPAPLRLAVPNVHMHPGKSYVLVGGLGGIGLELGDWLVSRGARTLVFNSRSGVRTGYQAWCIRRWRAGGVLVLESRADAAAAAGARTLLRDAATAAPVGGIFNLALVLRDAFFENQTPEAFRDVAKPKTDVTRALDVASRELAPQLDYFVAFSSVTSGRGNAGQSNYGLANSGVELVCSRRRAAGLPALAVQWGAVGDVGAFAARGAHATVGGTAPQRVASCLRVLQLLLARADAPAVATSMVVADKHQVQVEPTLDLVQDVANILGIKDRSKVPETATLGELGVDSLMSAEIKKLLAREYAVAPTPAPAVAALTFETLRAMACAAPLDQ